MSKDWKVVQFYLAVVLVCGSILLVYLWWASLGLWIHFPSSTNYYDLQATAFSHGQLALELQPDAALLQLENPYEPAGRENMAVLWDASLYKGRYYLYWGPAPALLVALIKPVYSQEIGDNLLTLMFTAGTFLFLARMILEFWSIHFPNTPRAFILAGIALAGLVNPMSYLLIEARVYEAAIAAGQFFFIGGLYFLFNALNRAVPGKFALAGIFFSLAIGSRNILILPVAFISIILLIWSLRNQQAQAITIITTYAVPLVIAGIAYAWYNFARFGSMTEFGYSYQLTGFNIHAGIKDIFSPAYIPPNLIKTLFNPFEFRKTFPFIKSTLWGGPAAWLTNYNPKIYYYLSEGITGLCVGSPFLLFALLRKRKELFWVSVSLAGSALLLLFMAQLFFYTAMRYLLDMVPVLTLLALLGFWSAYDSLGHKRLFTILGATLWAYTIVIGVLLPFSSNIKRFKEYNPDLFQHITNLFK